MQNTIRRLNAFKKIKTILLIWFSHMLECREAEEHYYFLAHCRLSLFTAGWISARPPTHSFTPLSHCERIPQRDIYSLCCFRTPELTLLVQFKSRPLSGRPPSLRCGAKCIISIRAQPEFNMMRVSHARVSVCIKWAASSSVCQTHTQRSQQHAFLAAAFMRWSERERKRDAQIVIYVILHACVSLPLHILMLSGDMKILEWCS